MKINRKRIYTSVFVIIFLSFATITAFAINNRSRFDELLEMTKGYKERAIESGNTDIQDIKITREANKDSKNIKDISEMSGYKKDEDLKDSAKYKVKRLMTYEEFMNNYTKLPYLPSISKDRMIWVTEIHYPNGIQHPKGFVKNAILTTFYDAETGESLGYGLMSLDPDGNGIKKN